MMARRTHDAEGILHTSAYHGVNGVQYSPSGAQRGIPRSRGNDRVAGTQFMKARHDLALDQPDIFGPMAQTDFVESGQEYGKRGELEARQPAHRGIKSFRALRVMRPGKVLLRNRVGGNPRH